MLGTHIKCFYSTAPLMRLCHGAHQTLEFVWSRFVSENTSIQCERKVHGQT